MGHCIDGCGACCNPVAATFTLDDLRRALPSLLTEDGRLNRAWALEHFTQIPRGHGLRATPEMDTGHTMAVSRADPTVLVEVWTYFFTCDAYDPDARTCTAYDDRPPMCSEYPWYGMKPDPTKAMPAECGYLPDIGREPVPVHLAPRRGTYA